MPLGKVISLEGIRGAGKTELRNRLKQYLLGRGFNVIIKHDLPLYTDPTRGLGEDIKDIIDKYNINNDPFYQDFPDQVILTLLIVAKRAFESQTRLLPALREGAIVIAERDIDTVCSYQTLSIQRANLPVSDEDIISLIRSIEALRCVPPSLTYYLRVSVSNAVRRLEGPPREETVSASERDFMADAAAMDQVVLDIPLPHRTLVPIVTDDKDKGQVERYALRRLRPWLRENFK